MKKQPRVLVVATTDETKNYCLDEFVSTIKALTYNNFKAVLADSSATKKNSMLIRSMGINCEWIEPKKKDKNHNLALCYQYFKDFAIIGKCDFILFLKSDVIPPVNIIESLLFHKKDIVSGCYITAENNLDLQIIEPKGEFSRHSTTMDFSMGDIVFMDGTVKQVYGASLGCTLVNKKVFEKIKFRHQEGIDENIETFFNADARYFGFNQYADTSIILEQLIDAQ
jgi:hypothetical protein